MQVVIDIDDNLYTRLFDNGNEYVADMRRACIAIRKGIQLPKGHGELKDVNEIWHLYDYNDIDYTMIDALNDAQTIIEEDKVRNDGEMDRRKNVYGMSKLS